MSKSAFVAIVGRPSAGKSTLINALCAHKVSIVSPVPQTTRNTVRGIVTKNDDQLVFVDTPGYHQSEKKINNRLGGLVKGSLDDADLTLYVIDSQRPAGEEEELLAKQVIKAAKPVIVAYNKCDVGSSRAAREFVAQIFAESTTVIASSEEQEVDEEKNGDRAKKLTTQVPVGEFDISAINGDGVTELSQFLFDLAPEGHAWYPSEYYTDQDPEFRIAEIIREQVMNKTREEIPHAAYVDIEDLQVVLPDGSPAPADYDASQAWELPVSKRPRLLITADIIIERESQKGIVIGKGGSLIKKIREEAEKEIRELFPYYIDLTLRIKVDPKWRGDDKILSRLLH